MGKKNELKEDQIRQLIRVAAQMRYQSYTPYSNYKVGAALLAADGTVFGGCNIENASYGATVCAERTAVFKAVSEGIRSFDAIAIMGGKDLEKGEIAPPCGICRQVLREFADPKEFLVIMAASEEDYRIRTLEELLPESFGPDNVRS